MPIDPTAVASALTGHDWQRAAALLLPLLAWALRRYAAPTTWAHRPAGAAAISLGLALVAAFAPVLDSHALTRQSAISAGTVALLSLAAVANPTQAAIKAAPTLAGIVVFLACGVASAGERAPVSDRELSLIWLIAAAGGVGYFIGSWRGWVARQRLIERSQDDLAAKFQREIDALRDQALTEMATADLAIRARWRDRAQRTVGSMIAAVVFLGAAVAHASTPPATPTIAPSGPVVTLPADPPATVAKAPTIDPTATAAALASLEKSLGISPSALTLPPSFLDSTGGKVLIGVLAVVGAGVSAAEAYAAVRSATLPATGATP